MMEAAREVGFAAKVAEQGWESATTEEIGHMVGAMVRKGKEVILRETPIGTGNRR